MEKKSELESWGKEITPEMFRKEDKLHPIVFNFRPIRFVKVSPDRIKDWEEEFAKKIGMRLLPNANEHCATVSGSGGVGGDWDDSDCW